MEPKFCGREQVSSEAARLAWPSAPLESRFSEDFHLERPSFLAFRLKAIVYLSLYLGSWFVVRFSFLESLKSNIDLPNLEKDRA